MVDGSYLHQIKCIKWELRPIRRGLFPFIFFCCCCYFCFFLEKNLPQSFVAFYSFFKATKLKSFEWDAMHIKFHPCFFAYFYQFQQKQISILISARNKFLGSFCFGFSSLLNSEPINIKTWNMVWKDFATNTFIFICLMV